ncbi:LCP family protein [Sinomonas notoginsengisoli]|uniref:LCP family protein n=1 Tax=Sinomonas notoginsengisoli TaxID=1457311 RepID=UPI001F1EE48C|nr:LCP family protein [Sinomonas notoginsengisoli]
MPESTHTPNGPGGPGAEAEMRRATRPRHRGGLIALLVALGIVVVAAIVAIVYLANIAGTFDSKTEKIPHAFPQESTRPSATPAADGRTAVNILLVGTDSRAATIDQAESGAASDQRSDTIMLVHIPADRKGAYVVSIMRDLWVPIPGHGTAKVNAALAYGGVPLMVQTAESLLHQRIDHVAFMDFEGFKGLTDAVGGVPVDVPLPFTAQQTEGNPHFDKGLQTLDGFRALAFVRERYSFKDGDYQRVRDQQIYLKALLNKVIKPETLANPVTVSQIVSQFSPYLTVDSGFDSKAVAGLALEMKDVRPSSVVSFTLPTSGTGWSPDGQSIVNLDQGATDALADAMAKGTVPQYVAQRNLQNGN